MANIEIDVDAIKSEVSALSKEQLEEQVLKLRTRQKIQQKRNYGSDKQKEYQLKQREKRSLLIARAKELGIFDEIDRKANEAAEEKLAEETADEDAA